MKSSARSSVQWTVVEQFGEGFLLPLSPLGGAGGGLFSSFSISTAKVVQKNEAGKKIPEQVQFTRGDYSVYSNWWFERCRIIESQVILGVLRKEDNVIRCELFGIDEIRAVIPFAEHLKEPYKTVSSEFFSNRGTKPFIKHIFGGHKLKVILRLMMSRAL